MLEVNLIFRGMLVVILGLFSVVFATLYLQDRSKRTAAWLSVAYFSGLGSFLLDISRGELDPVLSDIAAKLLFWGFFLLFVIAVHRKNEARLPVTALGSILGAGMLFLIWFSFQEPNIIMRSVFSAPTAGLILACALPLLWRERRSYLGYLLLVLVSALCLSNILRPLVIYGVMDATHTLISYQKSAFAVALYASSGLFALLCGLTMLAILISEFIEHSRQVAMTDPLTGLLNRRGLEQSLASAKGGAGRQETTVIIIDLEDLDRVTALHGREVWEQILTRTGAALYSVANEIGIVACIAEEEFVVVLSGAVTSERRTIAEHLRLSISNIIHPELGVKERVTASLAIAKAKSRETFPETLHRADMALLRARDKGRSRVVEAGSEDIPDIRTLPRPNF